VYRIRCKVAEPGTVIPPPDSAKPSSPNRKSARQSAQVEDDDESQELSESDAESDSDSASDKETVEFVPAQCLFCNQTSDDLDGNLAHMQQAHSLVVPFQSSLAVDLQTLIWYLHMVIFSYRECICCGKRRKTVEAVQQHMTSSGHCRFDIAEEMSEFYNMDSVAPRITDARSCLDEQTLRLPSGKLLAHRSYVDPTPKSRSGGKSGAGSSAALPDSQSNNPELQTQALTKKDRQEQALTAQISQLRTSDQMSLMHLPESQRRSLLLTHKKEMDNVKRAERRKRGRLDHVGNKTAIHTNYYKQEVPVYMGG
jgi:pre-60S factor REI1